MKICLLSNALSIHTKRWINCLQSRGHEVYLISFRKADIRDIYFKHYEPSQNNFFYKAFFFIKNLWAIRKEIGQIKPDILHTHYITSYGLVGALSGYRPLVVSIWGTDLFVDLKKSLIHRFIIKQVLKKADLVTVMAEHMVPLVKEIIGERNNIIKVTLGVDLNRFTKKESYPRKSAKCVILSCRAFEKEHNLETFVCSLPYVFRKNKKDIEVWFCNNGTYLQKIQNLCEELGVAPYVKFFGVVKHEDMPSYYANSDLYVSTASSDGDHVSMMEAMACGVFPIVSDIPANREWITDGQNGFLVPPGNPKLFAEKIMEAMKSDELRNKARIVNPKRVKERASSEKDLKTLEARYRTLLQNGKISIQNVAMNDEVLRIKEAYSKRKEKRNSQYSLFFSICREKEIKESIKRNGITLLDNKKILDVGCGNGEVLSYFLKDDVPQENLYGIDILPERIEKAKGTYPQIHFTCGNAEELPYPDEYFDIVTQSTMFTSILDAEMKRKVASEMLRVLRNDGIIIWHDYRYNNPFNPDVKGIGAKEIKALFPDCQFNCKLINLNPFIARPLIKISWKICKVLDKIHFLSTHWLVTIKKGSS